MNFSWTNHAFLTQNWFVNDFFLQGPEGLSHFLGQGLEELANLGSGRVQNGIESSGFSGQGLEKYGVEDLQKSINVWVQINILGGKNSN